MDINYQLPQIQRFPGLSEYTRQASLQALAPPPVLSNSAMNAVNQQRLNLFKLYQTLQNKNLLLGQAVSSLTGQLSNQVSEGIFGTDTELGQAMGNLFSTGINTAGDQVVNNIFKGESLMNGMSQNVGSSLAGAGAGIAANYIGKGISSLGGNSKLSRGLGAGFATGAGTLGGGALSNIINGERAFGDIADSFKAIKTFNQAKKAADFAKDSPEALEALKASKLGTLNLAGLGASVVGSGLQAAFGPSKEYGGTYGNITRGLDTAYDLVQGAAGFIPGVGTAVSGFMALNKGLSNIFGSTSGMCVCAGTKVFTANGDIINIENLKQEQGIIGWNLITHEIRPNTIKGFLEPRLKECLEIELKNGTILKCSIDHPILSNTKPKAESHYINGKRIAFREWSFRRADELKVGDWVGFANNIDYWGNEEMPNAYLVGMLIGDGTYTYESSCKLWTADQSTWKYLEENNLAVLIKQYTPENSNGKYSTENRDYRIINGMLLVKDLGIAYQSGVNKTLPKNIGKYNKNSICKMIAGLYDTDGSFSVNEEKGDYKVTLYQSNLDLLENLKLILLKLGIFSIIYTRKASINKMSNGRTINSNISYRLEVADRNSIINFYKNIPLNIDYKKNNLERIYKLVLPKLDKDHCDLSGAKQYKIISIKSIGIQTVYNLEALEDHTYIANGIITHNTRQDAILGSAFMPAPVKWLNMAGAKTTDKFRNQSWLNQERTNTFMQNGFGDLGEKFDKARRESGKTYGTFSRHAYNKAQGNLNFANDAFNKILDMAYDEEIRRVRSEYMTSINNQRYAQDIAGGFRPLYRGKEGMKIPEINHNFGQRLLSGAALIDNKQMILSALSGTKVKRPKMRPHGSPERTRPSYMTEEEWNEYLEDKKRFEEYKKSIGKETDYGTPYTEEELQLLKEYNAWKQAEINLKILERNKAKEEAAARFNLQANLVLTTMTQQANETPFTGQEYQQAAENLRQEKIEKFHEKAEELGKGFEAALMADMAVSAAPLLLRGFRWAFNKTGLLVKVPKLTELFSLNLNSEKFINPDGSINVQEAVPEIVRGKKFAIEYLNSPTRTAVNAHNKELANRLGFKLFRPFNEAGQRVSTPSNLKIVRENSSIGGSVSTDSRNPAADLVTINLYNSDPYFASMHENLHRGYLGNAPKEYFLNETRGTFGDTNRFYDYLKDKLLKPWSERYNLPAADYLDLSAELAVNMFEVGQRMGLKVGQKFPGNLKVLELLEKFKNSGDYKSGVVDHLNLKHPLRIWKALTGTLFSVPLIYGTVNNTIGLKTQ